MKTISVFRAERITFKSAYAFCREQGLSRKVAKAILDQPGYRRKSEMTIAQVETGYRLFVRVSGQWMDGSLKDLAW
jgi:hypothetical protein